jgi:hypothetical protein
MVATLTKELASSQGDLVAAGVEANAGYSDRSRCAGRTGAIVGNVNAPTEELGSPRNFAYSPRDRARPKFARTFDATAWTN